MGADDCNAMLIQLTDLLQPLELSITNDSAAHRHHAPMRAIDGGSGETHFTVRAVSDKFEGLVRQLRIGKGSLGWDTLNADARLHLLQNQMKRHRMIYSALKEELDAGLHALALQTKTPKEVGMVPEEGAAAAATEGTQ